MMFAWTRRRHDVHVARCGAFKLLVFPSDCLLNGKPHVCWMLNIERGGVLLVSKEVRDEAHGKRRAPVVLAQFIKRELRVLENVVCALEALQALGCL